MDETNPTSLNLPVGMSRRASVALGAAVGSAIGLFVGWLPAAWVTVPLVRALSWHRYSGLILIGFWLWGLLMLAAAGGLFGHWRWRRRNRPEQNS